MKYTPPINENGKPYHVPVVAKNKDVLIGYLSGVISSKDIINELFLMKDIDTSLNPIDYVLDSSRFNDILENDKKASDMTQDELTEYMVNLVTGVFDNIESDSTENGILEQSVLTIECKCGYGYYSWDKLSDIPDDNFVCSQCGRVLIDYTNEYDFNIEYEE